MILRPIETFDGPPWVCVIDQKDDKVLREIIALATPKDEPLRASIVTSVHEIYLTRLVKLNKDPISLHIDAKADEIRLCKCFLAAYNATRAANVDYSVVRPNGIRLVDSIGGDGYCVISLDLYRNRVLDDF